MEDGRQVDGGCFLSICAILPRVYPRALRLPHTTPDTVQLFNQSNRLSERSKDSFCVAGLLLGGGLVFRSFLSAPVCSGSRGGYNSAESTRQDKRCLLRTLATSSYGGPVLRSHLKLREI